MHTMRRKLVKQGPSSLTVSVPSEWVKSNKLKPGDEVSVLIEPNGLSIQAEPVDDNGDTIAVDVRSLHSGLLSLVLSALHKKGYHEIRLKVSKGQIETVQRTVEKNLLGFEIVQHSGDTVVVRFVTKVDPDELPVLIRRAFLVTLAIAEGVAADGETQELLVLEETNNRITNYCERILVRSLSMNKQAVFQYLIVWLLEKTADEYRNIILSGRVDREDSELCLAILKSYYELYYKYSLAGHNEFLASIKEAIASCKKRDSPYLPVLLTIDQAKASLIALHIE